MASSLIETLVIFTWYRTYICFDALVALLQSSLGSLLDCLGGVDHFVLDLLGSLSCRAGLAAFPEEDTGDLDDTDASQEEVHGSKTKVEVSDAVFKS